MVIHESFAMVPTNPEHGDCWLGWRSVKRVMREATHRETEQILNCSQHIFL